MTSFTYREAIIRAMSDEMAADDDVFVLGEDVGASGGAFKMTDGLFERFGPERVRDTPISEQVIIGAAIGAAVRGLRPVAEIMFADFAAVCFDQIANELAKYRYMTGGQVTLPVTIRLANGANGFAAQHSQACENWFLNIPGLKIVVPATPSDAYELLRASIRDPDPVLFFEHKALFNDTQDFDPVTLGAELGGARVVRQGSDITVVATQLMCQRAVVAAELLASEDISVEVIDPRSLRPIDLETMGASVDRTHHLVIVQEAPNIGSWGATIAAELLTGHFESFDAPCVLLGADETPVPYSSVLEEAWRPSVEQIAQTIRASLTY